MHEAILGRALTKYIFGLLGYLYTVNAKGSYRIKLFNMLKYAFQHYLTDTHFDRECQSFVVSLILASDIYNLLYRLFSRFSPDNKSFTNPIRIINTRINKI